MTVQVSIIKDKAYCCWNSTNILIGQLDVVVHIDTVGQY